mgnify:CR=1 FL=1|jgi:RimJ/RimL family protein N-acetyltransferase
MIALTGTPTLTTERLTLRAPIAADWPAFRAFAMSDRALYSFGIVDEAKSWRAFCHVAGMWVMRGHGLFILCLKGTDHPLGACGPWHPADWPEREIGWSLWSAEAEGRGYALEAAAAARAHAFGTLGWDTAVSYIHPDNARSIALARRLGATEDPAATTPHPDEPTLVFRHQRGAA